MSEARSVRFESGVLRRLRRWAAAHPGSSLSGAANQLIDEALRMEEHPGVVFRDGPAGRRAALAGGPDLWEVVRVLNDVRAANADVTRQALVAATAESLGIAEGRVRVALHYYGDYPDEIHEQVAAAEEFSVAAERAWRVEQRLLA